MVVAGGGPGNESVFVAEAMVAMEVEVMVVVAVVVGVVVLVVR